MALSRSISNLSPSIIHFDCNEIFGRPRHNDVTMDKLHNYFKTGKLCDVTLLAEEVSVKAHRVVLSAVSDYFSAMFTSNLLESRSETVKIMDVDGEALKELVTYAYSGQIDLTKDNVESLMRASSLMGFPDVLEQCCRFLYKHLDSSNCLGIALISDSVACYQLQNTAYTFSREHFMEVIEHQEFVMLSHKDLGQLLKHDDLNVASEIIVFNALLKWVNHDRDSRQQHLSGLMKFIRLPLIPPMNFLKENQLLRLYSLSDFFKCQRSYLDEENEFLVDNIIPELGSDGKDSIIEALQYHLFPERREKINSYQLTPRKSTLDMIYAIAGTSLPNEHKSSTNIEVYNPRTESWKNVDFLPGRHGRRLQLGVASINNQIYVAGGRDGLRTLNSVECYDTSTKTWRSVPDMTTPRHGLGFVAIQPNGPLYAIGGHDGWSYLNTVERWHPDSGFWTNVTSLLCARSTAGVAVLNNRIYAVGGRDNVSCLKSVEVYDPHTNTWSYCSSMNKRRGGVAIAVLNGYIYALGGHDVTTSNNPSPVRYSCVERYDPKNNIWTYVAKMNWARDGIAATLLGNRILAAGGFSGTSYLKLVEVYDCTKNQWNQIAHMNYARAGPCVTATTKMDGDKSSNIREQLTSSGNS